MLEGTTCRAALVAHDELQRTLPPPPLGACMIPIVRNYCELITAGMRVLDVGCGSWTAIRDHCQTVGAVYEGIDVIDEYFGRKAIATRIEGLQDLSFADETFDLVIGNQSMEHWAENGCSLEWGLYQCFRVCRAGGRVCMNVPIHFHGTGEFLMGRLDKLQSEFSAFSSNVRFEKWGLPSKPLPDYVCHPNYPPLRNKSAYVLDIQAIKDRPLHEVQRPRFAPKNRIGELVNLPLSFNIYRVIRKLGWIGAEGRFAEHSTESIHA